MKVDITHANNLIGAGMDIPVTKLNHFRDWLDEHPAIETFNDNLVPLEVLQTLYEVFLNKFSCNGTKSKIGLSKKRTIGGNSNIYLRQLVEKYYSIADSKAIHKINERRLISDETHDDKVYKAGYWAFVNLPNKSKTIISGYHMHDKAKAKSEAVLNAIDYIVNSIVDIDKIKGDN